MKKLILNFSCILLLLSLLSACVFGGTRSEILLKETRTELIGTNIICIAGEPAEEPYIEILYSIADEDNPGFNKTASIMVSPPYIFQNNNVYITFEYVEYKFLGDLPWYTKTLFRSFEEGGAEYLKIINHSSDKLAEFFIAGSSMRVVQEIVHLPAVEYKKAPVYYLLFPEMKPFHNIHYQNGLFIYFEGDRIGDLTVTEAWSVEEVLTLYHLEYNNSGNERLTLFGFPLFDLVKGKITGQEIYLDKIFYGVIEPRDILRGNEKIWLLATYEMFFDEFETGKL